MGEEEAMLRVRQAVLTYASSRAQHVPSTNPEAYENETPDEMVEGSGQASGLLAYAASRMRQVPRRTVKLTLTRHSEEQSVPRLTEAVRLERLEIAVATRV